MKQKKYSVDWSGDGEHIKYFSTKKEAVNYLEMCAGVYIEKVMKK